MVTITALYGAINGLIVLVLAVLVSRQRRRSGTALGSGPDPALERAIRAHGNAVENVPLVLLLMLTIALGGGRPAELHVIGIALTLGRLLHAWGLSQSRGPSFGRAAGMALTWLSLIAAILGTLALGLGAL